MVYLLNYMLEVRRAGTGDTGGGDAGDAGADGKKQPVIISLDEARLMFWLEVQVLFEMSAVMVPSREDMSKVYDKFFRPVSGFYVHELAADKRQVLGHGYVYSGGGRGRERCTSLWLLLLFIQSLASLRLKESHLGTHDVFTPLESASSIDLPPS